MAELLLALYHGCCYKVSISSEGVLFGLDIKVRLMTIMENVALENSFKGAANKGVIYKRHNKQKPWRCSSQQKGFAIIAKL